MTCNMASTFEIAFNWKLYGGVCVVIERERGKATTLNLYETMASFFYICICVYLYELSAISQHYILDQGKKYDIEEHRGISGNSSVHWATVRWKSLSVCVWVWGWENGEKKMNNVRQSTKTLPREKKIDGDERIAVCNMRSKDKTDDERISSHSHNNDNIISII